MASIYNWAPLAVQSYCSRYAYENATASFPYWVVWLLFCDILEGILPAFLFQSTTLIDMYVCEC